MAVAPIASAGVLPTGTYRYDVLIDGRGVGKSSIVVSRDAGTIEIRESASLLGAAIGSRRTLTAAFAAQSYAGDAGAKHFAVEVAGNEATLTASGLQQKIAAAPGAPFLVADNMPAGFALIPATLHATGAKALTLACVCPVGFVAVPVTATGSSTAPPVGVPSGDASLTVTMDRATATLWFNAQTYVLDRMDLPSQQLSIELQSYDAALATLSKPVAPTPLPLPSPHYASRDVTIVADDGVKLRGTLTLPDGATAPRPGFVFVHGSGCEDRDETIGPNKIFAQLTNNLSNDGYAVLRYDKRSCGRSGGTFPTRDRLIADARDAIAYLRAQPGINPKRIYVLGHSEGGELAPSIAIADKHLRGIVLLAPPALPLEQILMQQALHYSTAANRSAVAKEERAQLDAIAAGKRPGAQARWLRSTFGIDPAALIARVPCPILIVQGTKDFQVLPSDTPRLVIAARSAHRDVTIKMLPGDDHLFINLPGDQTSSISEYFIPSYLDPALFAAIDSWLKSN
jgi:pimeloyl-ACP methyl ester carboxylesterase